MSGDLISRKAVIDALTNLHTHDGMELSASVDYAEACDAICDIPAVDAEPVIRCKDCDCWGDSDGIKTHRDGYRYARCRFHNNLVNGSRIGWCPKEDDFCSMAEKKDAKDG